MPPSHVQVDNNSETRLLFRVSPSQERETFTRHFVHKDSYELKLIIQIFSNFSRVDNYILLLGTLCVRIHHILKLLCI